MISKSNAPQEFYMQDPFGQEEQRAGDKKGNALDIPGRAHDQHRISDIFLSAQIFGRRASSGLAAQAANFAFFINLILAAFNLLPFGPLDGKKIFDSNRMVWLLVGLPTILLGLLAYMGMI